MAQLRRALAFLRALFLTTPHLLNTRTGRLYPVLGGAEGDDADDDADADADREDDDQDDDDEDDDTVDSESDDEVKPGDDWKAKSRKNEAKAKRERKAREKAEAELQKLKDADKSEQQKAIDKAKEEARTEFEKERRSARLDAASTRLAAKGFTIGEGDDAETVKFADPDDALVYIERAISRGDVDADDIFDEDGKVDSDALRTELVQILEEKPHLRAGANGGGGKPKGDPDSRKGGKAGKDLEQMTPEDHAKRKYAPQK